MDEFSGRIYSLPVEFELVGPEVEELEGGG